MRNDRELTRTARAGIIAWMYLPFSTLGGVWILALKILAAMGFMTVANVVILYAC